MKKKRKTKKNHHVFWQKTWWFFFFFFFLKKSLPFNASQQSTSSSYPYSFSCAAQKNLPHNSVQQNKRRRRGRKKKQRDKKILNRNRTHHDLLWWNYSRRHLVQTQEKSSSQRCSCRLNLNKACVGFFCLGLEVWGNVFVLFFSWRGVGVDNGHLLLSSSSSSAVHHLRPSTHTLFSLSLSLSLSFFLSFFSLSLSLSLSTDNNNFTKDKVLSSRAKQQRAKQNPKKKKRDRDFWGRFIRKIFWANRFPSFLPSNGVSSNPAAKPQKKKNNAYPDPSSYLAPNCATTAFPKTPPHKQVNSLLRFANPKRQKKYDYFFTVSLSFFPSCPYSPPQPKSLLKNSQA